MLRAKDQVWCELAQEAVILNFKSGVYFGLNPVAARVWSLIQEPRTVSALLAMLLDEYDVAPDRCEHDLVALLADLAARDLIEVKAGFDGSAA